MKTRSILAFVLVVAALTVAAVASAAADPGTAAKPDPNSVPDAGASLSAGVWTHGLFGTLKTDEDGCTADRRVVVFEQEGDDRDPGRDRQVEVTRTADGAQAGDWSIRGGAGDPGRYYARADATERCAAVASDAVRPDLGDSSKQVPICGEWDKREPVPKVPDECRIAFRLAVAGCGGKHLGDDTSIDCDDPDGLPCFCSTIAQFRFPAGDRTRTYVRIQTRTNPFISLEAEGLGDEAGPDALFARYVGGGGLYSPMPFRADPGEPGGPLLISEDEAGTTIRVEGYVYKR